MTGSIAVVVLSYNRPRMLREALGSIVGAAEVWLADDGSDFDVLGLASEFGIPAERVVVGPKLTPAERARTSNCGHLVNACLRRVGAEYVGYLCDDDLFAPGWLAAAAKALDDDEASHMVRGTWRKFEHGRGPEQSEPLTLGFDFELTTGNFAHRTACGLGCGCWWPEGEVSCHDAIFLRGYLTWHGARDIRHVGALAGYRREHPHNMIRYTVHSTRRYLPEAEALFARGMLE